MHSRIASSLALPGTRLWPDRAEDALLASRISTIAALAALAIGLFIACHIVDFLFRSRELSDRAQLRASAMAAYSCAPLAWIWLPMLVLALTSHLVLAPDFLPANSLQAGLIIAGWMFVAIAWQWWFVTVLMIRLTTACSWLRMLVSALLLPFVWIALIAGLTAASICGVALLSLMRDSR
jgi:hypothetical protein